MGDRISFGEAARNYHVDKGDVQKWVAAYQAYGMAGIIKQRISYPGKFKQEVIEDMRANNLSLRETAAKFNLGNHGVVANWERIYMEEGTEGLYLYPSNDHSLKLLSDPYNQQLFSSRIM